MNSDIPHAVALVPTYNGASFIEETLDSLARQSYGNLRVLISNDASTDRTAEICDQYASRDPRFTVIHQPHNLGWIGNVNALLEAAEGDYFFIAYHDDVYMPDYVHSLVGALEREPAAILAYPDIEYQKDDGSITTPSFRDLDGITDRYARVRVMASKPHHNAIPVLGMFRASAFALAGGLRSNLAGEFVADWPWLIGLLVHGHFVRVPDVLCRKIVRTSGVASGWRQNPISRLAVVLSCAGVIKEAEFSRREKWSLYFVLIRSYPLIKTIHLRRWLRKNRVLKRIHSRIKA